MNTMVFLLVMENWRNNLKLFFVVEQLRKIFQSKYHKFHFWDLLWSSINKFSFENETER